MLKIAIAQIKIIPAVPYKNFETICKNVEKAIEQNYQLIIFPEMCLSGYFIGDFWEQQAFLNECHYYHEKIRELSQKITIIFGSVAVDEKNLNEDGRVRKYNAAFIAHKQKFLTNTKTNLSFWPKALLPNYRGFDDSRYFYDLRKLAYEKNLPFIDLYEPAKLQFDNKIFFVGISICEDAWAESYPISPIKVFAEHFHHDFFINLSCSPYTKLKYKKREEIFSNLAKEINTPIYYVNCVGVQNIGKTIFGFDGDSACYFPNKKTHNFFQPFEEGLNLVNKQPSQGELQIENTRIAIEYILKSTCENWNIKRVVIGVSGGIDSALSAVIMSRVLGPENVFLINMPSRFNSELTKNAAVTLAKNLQSPFAVFPIDEFVDLTQSQLEKVQFLNSAIKIQVTNSVFENIQARDRGTRLLASIAASLNAVFTCNANKTELTVGYGTLYGDIAGFLCPIGDLWKHEVYELAHYYNDVVFKKEIIPNAIFDVKPSAELSEAQNVLLGKGDPIIYEYHDYLFRSWVEDWQRKTPEDCLIAFLDDKLDALIGCPTGTSKQLFASTKEFCEDLERWWLLYQGLGAVKRMQAPPIIAISRRAFGFDHREHLGNPILTTKYLDTKMDCI